MAALTHTTSALLGLFLGFGPSHLSRAEDAKTTTTPAPAPAPPQAPAAQDSAQAKVRLVLDVAGLGPKGCDIEIAPGHAGSRFRPVSFHVSQHEANKLKLDFEDIQTAGSDRYCMFAITIREPGQPVMTVRRGLRLVAPTSDSGQTTPQVLFCYVSSPSKLARASEMRERR
jgi:hypothetical protein